MAGRSVTVDLDVQIGLPEDSKNSEVSYSLDLIHFAHDLRSELFQSDQIRTDDFHRVGALHAR